MEIEFSSLLVLLPFLLVGFLYLSKGRRKDLGDVRRLPPQPRGLPIIGNLHQVGALPHRNLRALAAANGAPDLLRLRLGHVEAVVASSPAAAAALMREHDHVFATRPSQGVCAEILTYGFQDMVFAPHGEHWRHVRRLCTTHVLSGARSHSFNGMREREVAALVRAVRDRVSSSPGAVVDVSDALYRFANEVICQAVSGRVRPQDGGSRSRSQLFWELIEENSVLLGGFFVGDFFPSLAWVDEALSGASARARRNLKRWDDLLETVVKEHEARCGRDEGDGADMEEDFVDVLLRLQAQDQEDDGFVLSRDTMKALLEDMFAAGTETSYNALEWAMSELVKNPRTMERLQHEVRSAAVAGGVVSADALGAASTPYLRAVVKETLRLHPPAPLLIPRECTRDTTVLGFHVARGTRVFINAWAVNRDPASWPTPDEFRPERFLDSDVDFRGAHFQFIPFGAGRRICPGMQFALATVELALANLVRLFDWELPDGAAPAELDMGDAPGLNTKRRVPLRLVAKPRE